LISNNIIRNYTPSSAGGYAIHLDYSNSIIVNNLIDNNSITAINVYFSGAKIKNNIITNNLTAFQISGGDSEIFRNTVKNNTHGGFYLQFGANPKIQYNNVFQNGASNNDVMKNNNIWMAQNTDIAADHNYWATTDVSLINTNIHDYYDNIGLGKVKYEPYALAELKFDGTDTFSQPEVCTSWTYSDWGVCSSNGQQIRSVISSLPSGCSGGNPVLTQSCTYTPPTCTSWNYSNWSNCSNGQQTRTITSSQPANCTGGNPILSQSCNSTPVCAENNWTATLTPTNCPSNGQQTKKWTKVGECQGGVSHISEENVSCDYQIPTCTNFTYSDWGMCGSSGVQSRTTLSTSPSGCTGGSPILSRSCNYVAPCDSDTWSCGNWSDCSANGSQARVCTKTFNCPDIETESPVINQHCEISNQNSQNEPTPTKNNEEEVSQEKNINDSQVAEQRRSEVANAVQEILQVAERDSGVGQQVKIIAQTQVQNQEKLEISLQKVQNRNRFVKFFVGPNYEEINNAKKLLEQNREQIEQLNQVKNQLVNQDDQQKLTEQIQLFEQSNQEIENSLNTSRRGFSLFGWLFELFSK
jgi:parallel beta-helix repeat protein